MGGLAMRRIPQFRLLLASATLLAGAVSASYAQTPAQMEYERQQRKPMPAQWWWYLDVLLQLPEPSAKFSEPALMPA